MIINVKNVDNHTIFIIISKHVYIIFNSGLPLKQYFCCGLETDEQDKQTNNTISFNKITS